MKKKKKKKVAAEAKDGDVIVVLNSKHIYNLWGDGDPDPEGNPRGKLLAVLKFGENLVGAKEWAQLLQRTDVKKAIKRGTMLDKGPAPKGYQIRVEDEEEEIEEDDEDGGESSD